jgi:phosphonate transport system substrate-binding protein
MKTYLVILVLLAAIFGLATSLWILVKPGPGPLSPAPAASAPATSAVRPIVLDITPERDPVEQMCRYRDLAAYLGAKLNRRVTCSVVSTYQGVLADLAENQADGGFVGSMVGALAIDRMQAKVLVKPRNGDGVSTYRGVLFVRDDSPIKSVDDLAGHSLGMVRATTAGDLFPILLLHQAKLLDTTQTPRQVWCGTHDEVIESVVEGRIDAGAVKDLRLISLLRRNPGWKLRRIAVGAPVPNNALIVRAGMDPDLAARLGAALLAMADDPAGRAVLGAMNIDRFVPCSASEYAPVYDMVRQLGPDWSRVGVGGPPPLGLGATTAPFEKP